MISRSRTTRVILRSRQRWRCKKGRYRASRTIPGDLLGRDPTGLAKLGGNAFGRPTPTPSGLPSPREKKARWEEVSGQGGFRWSELNPAPRGSGVAGPSSRGHLRPYTSSSSLRFTRHSGRRLPVRPALRAPLAATVTGWAGSHGFQHDAPPTARSHPAKTQRTQV